MYYLSHGLEAILGLSLAILESHFYAISQLRLIFEDILFDSTRKLRAIVTT
jgi:hypothetical protein